MSDRPIPDPIPEEPEVATVHAEEAQTARSGFLLITGAKLWFLVTATVLNLGLPRLLGDAAQFGDFGTVNSLISILNMVLVTGVLQAVSKRVSERPALAGLVRAKAVRVQTVLGGGLFVVLIVGADAICGGLLRDPSLAPYLRIAAVVSLSYAFYASFIGLLNGLKAFAQQAMFDIVFATLKICLIGGLVLAGFGVMGAFSGFAAAAVIVTIAAWWLTHRKVRALPPPPPGERVELVGFMLQAMGFVLAMNVLIQGDVVVLKRAAFEAVQGALQSGVSLAWADAMLEGAPAGGEPARTITAGLVGLFRATKNVSLLPYQGVIALTFVIFPLLSRSTFETDDASTRTYVRQALRTAWLLVAAIATVVAAGGEGLAVALFGDAYGLAGVTVVPMIIGMACLAMFYLIGCVLIAAGRPMDALLVAGVVAVVEMVVLYFVTASSDAGAPLLARAAWTTAAAGFAGMTLACLRLVMVLRVTLPGVSFFRGALASAAGLVAVSLLGDPGIWWVFVRAAAAGVVFLVVLVLTREFTREDWSLVRSTLDRRKAS